MSLKTREQVRMQATWDALHTQFGEEKAWRSNAKKYLTAVKKTPSRICTSGLGQALAFLRSRGPKEAGQDIEKLTLQLLGGTASTGTDLLARLRDGDQNFYFVATEEAILICEWFASYLSGAGVKDEDADAAPTAEPTDIAEALTPTVPSEPNPAHLMAAPLQEAQETGTVAQKEVTR